MGKAHRYEGVAISDNRANSADHVSANTSVRNHDDADRFQKPPLRSNRSVRLSFCRERRLTDPATVYPGIAEQNTGL